MTGRGLSVSGEAAKVWLLRRMVAGDIGLLEVGERVGTDDGLAALDVGALAHARLAGDADALAREEIAGAGERLGRRRLLAVHGVDLAAALGPGEVVAPRRPARRGDRRGRAARGDRRRRPGD